MATPLALLQFLVFKNYASILEDEYKMDPKKPKDLAEKALDHYINVSMSDRLMICVQRPLILD